MSTRSSIFYDEEKGIHIYYELLDGTVCLEFEKSAIVVNIVLMSADEWKKFLEDALAKAR